jgi:hypothetical protein
MCEIEMKSSSPPLNALARRERNGSTKFRDWTSEKYVAATAGIFFRQKNKPHQIRDSSFQTSKDKKVMLMIVSTGSLDACGRVRAGCAALFLLLNEKKIRRD